MTRDSADRFIPASDPTSPVSVVGKHAGIDASRGVTVWLEHRDFAGWRFEVTVTAEGVPVGFSISPSSTDEDLGHWLKQLRATTQGRRSQERRPLPVGHDPVTARLLRQVPLGELQKVAIREWRREARRWSRHLGVSDERYRVQLERWAVALDERPGSRGRPDRHYAEVAAAYVAELGSGTEVRDLAAELHYSERQVRNFLTEARRRGLLTEAPKGRAGGQLTERAVELLEQEENS